MIDSWLNTLGTLISESVWLAPLLALLAGVLTSFTPCSLSSIPLVIGYVGGTGTGWNIRLLVVSGFGHPDGADGLADLGNF